MGNVTHAADIGGGSVSIAFVSSRTDDRSIPGQTTYSKYETYRITAEPDAGCELLGLQFRSRYWYVSGSSIGTTQWNEWSQWWDGPDGGGYNTGVTQTGTNEYEFWTESANFQTGYPQNAYQPYWGQIYEVRGVFTQAQHVIATASNPPAGGTTTGGGTYAQGASCTITATPASGYHFVKWTCSDGTEAADATHTFTVTSSLTFTAQFREYTHMPLFGTGGAILFGSGGSILCDA